MQSRVLIVDDEPLVCRSLSELVSRAGYETHIANSGHEALEAIQQKQFSVVITDVSMPRMSGLEVLQRVKRMVPDIAVVMMTGYATVDCAVEAMKHGAHDYIAKPFSPAKIETVIENAIGDGLGRSAAEHGDTEEYSIVTADPQMLDTLNRVKLIAQTDCTVLIQGETGTGKELIARTIHGYSRRAHGPFVAVNCAALPEGLIESELFGHEAGAFTGAIARRIGKLQMAHGGTLLLDEVSEMAKPFQAKLLRAIQEREVVRVGGTSPIKVDVRIIATTNKELLKEVDKGNFREDLFYRIFVVPVFLPPLRERKDDIPLLARYFTQQFCTRMNQKTKTVSEETMRLLKEYSWPGNIRELENTLERAVALSQGNVIWPRDLLLNARSKASNYVCLEVGTSLQEAERELILRTLEEVDGNKQKAAEILGITSKTIRSKLRQYGED